MQKHPGKMLPWEIMNTIIGHTKALAPSKCTANLASFALWIPPNSYLWELDLPCKRSLKRCSMTVDCYCSRFKRTISYAALQAPDYASQVCNKGFTTGFIPYINNEQRCVRLEAPQ